MRSAISLIELVAVITILAAVAAVVIPRVSINSGDTKKNACYVTKGNVEVQVQRFFRDQGRWPQSDLADMLPPTTSEYFPDGAPTCPLTGQTYQLDPTTHHVLGHTH